MTTKNQIYTSLISLGREHPYYVIPEFNIRLNDGGNFKAIDLVWANRRNNNFQNNLSQYEVKYAFEIEGFDVRNSRLEQLIDRFNYLYQEPNEGFIRGITILYDNAYDRPTWEDRINYDNNRKLAFFNNRKDHYLDYQQREYPNLHSRIIYGNNFVGHNII